MIAALYVSRKGHYWDREGIDAWDEVREARDYDGPFPVVCHSPCNLWVNMAAVNWKRYGRQKPAWYEGGSDGGCFYHALWCILNFGGVLEHPAGSHAWAHFKLPPVGEYGWRAGWYNGYCVWACEVWQSAYGHQARKRTWLLYHGVNPPADMNWERSPGTHQIGWFDRNKPTLSKTAALLTPPAFADALIELAKGAR